MAISVENREIFPPRVLCATAEGVPLGIGYRRLESTKLRARERSLTISSAVWIQSTNVTDGQIDGQRVTAKTAFTHIAVR